MKLQGVDFGGAVFEVIQEGLGGEGGAGGLFDEGKGVEPASGAVDMFPEPLEGGVEPALLDAIPETGDVGFHFAGEHGGVDISEGVAGEIPEMGSGPMDILEATTGGIGRLDSKVIVIALVPGLGKILHIEGALDELAFEVEPDEDMEVVGDFIGFDPDETGLDGVDGAEEGVCIGHAELGGEIAFENGENVAAEGPAVSKNNLPESRLGLMHTIAGSLGEGGGVILGVESLVVKGVTGFVDGGADGAPEVVVAEPGGDADVGHAETGGERVHGHVLASPLKIETEVAGDPLDDLALFGYIAELMEE